MTDLDNQLRNLFPDHAPSEADRGRIDAAYRTRLAATPVRRWPLTAATAAILVAVAAIGVTILTPSRVEAALTEFVDIARSVEVADIEDGTFWYTESESVHLAVAQGPGSEETLAYLLPVRRQIWIQPVGGVTVLATTSGEPTILTPGGTELYERFGRPGDRPGETITVAQESYEHPAEGVDSSDPDDLEAWLRAPAQVDTDTKVAAAALGLITESPATPDLRAAVLGVLAALDLTLVDETEDTVTLQTRPTDADDTQITFTIRADGQLLYRADATTRDFDDIGIEAGFVTFEATYQPTRTTDTAPDPGGR